MTISNPMSRRQLFRFLYILAIICLSACSAPLSSSKPEAISVTRHENRGKTYSRPNDISQRKTSERIPPAGRDNLSLSARKPDFTIMPSPPTGATQAGVDIESPEYSQQTMPVNINFDSIPLPAFINEIYGNILKKTYQLDQKLRNKKDLISLRTATSLSPTELDQLARTVLSRYGVGIRREGDRLLHFIPVTAGRSIEPPLLITGETLPNVPADHRPVFMLVPLKVVRNTEVRAWVQKAYKGMEIEVSEDMMRNAILLFGPPHVVSQAARAVKVLDQPNMRGRHCIRVQPAFISAERLSGHLMKILKAEGYAATDKAPGGSVFLLPVDDADILLVFAADTAILDHIQQWISRIDIYTPEDTEEQNLFYYQVKNTRAKELATVLRSISSEPAKNRAKIGFSDKGDKKTVPLPQAKPGITVDEIRNAIIFQGTPRQWQKLTEIIDIMDTPDRLVLIEVTIAEVTLTDDLQTGIEWLTREVKIGNFSGVLQTLEGLNIGSGGLTYAINDTRSTMAVLNAFASTKQVSILSTPRIVVKSGTSATIDVGTEVPVITSKSTASDLKDNLLGTRSPSILQEIQYRKTGTLLSVEPVILSGNRVDLKINQEVSEVIADKLNSTGSPSIFTRRINTNLSLHDGGSVLLAGLISSSDNKGKNEVPWLGDIPLLGALFRSDTSTRQRTELMMLIVPYIINNHQDAARVTSAFLNSLSNIRQADQAGKNDDADNK